MSAILLFLLIIRKSLDAEILIRDVGVAGSNPVTQTTDLHKVFLTPPITVPDLKGSRFQKRIQFWPK
jgi:hypothetical protein